MNIKKLRNRKIFIITFLLITICFLVNFLPSLARVKNRTTLETLTVWNGEMASSYRKGTGTKNDPYVIASGQELSYFSEMLKVTNYEGKYFLLNNDILLNQGTFSYENSPKYTLNKSTFYLKEYSKEFYDNKDYSGINIGSVNMLNSLNNFKGHFDGNSHTIYGLYISKNDEELGFFTNLEGSVKNLYLVNSLIYGGNITGGIAASANNSHIENVLFSGFVVGNKEVKRIEKNFTITVDETPEYTKSITLPSEITKTDGTIIESILSGHCTSDFSINENPIKCIENSFTFNIQEFTSSNLTIGDLDELNELSDLNLKVKYDLSIAGGIIGIDKNSNLKNVINKAQVNSSLLAGGLIGTSSNSLQIDSSYNKGKIDSNVKGGLIGEIKNIETSSLITKSYNDSNGGLNFIETVSNANQLLTIENSFNVDATSSKFIENIINTQIDLQNVYTTSNYESNSNYNGFVQDTTKSNLIDKQFMQNNLSFNEFQDLENLSINPSNQWIYEEGYLPTLYIDDIQNPIATLTVGTYSWNNLGFDENIINLSKETAFSIDEMSNTNPLKEKMYYIAHTNKPLTKEEINAIEWTPYENIVTIKEDGFYIVYAKVTDFNGKTSIINSDIFVIDTKGPEVKLQSSYNEWNNFKTELDYTFIDTKTDFTIEAADTLSGVKTIEYNITNNYKTLEELNSLEWTTYSEKISIENLGTNVINIKVTDNSGNTTFINSNFIIYGGYNLEEIKVGQTIEKSEIINMTNRSKISLKFSYRDSIQLKPDEKHYLIVNKPLPSGAKIILKDNKKNKVYSKEVSSEETEYAFSSFEEIGKKTMIENFKEEYTNTIDEDFIVSINFQGSKITENIDDIKVSIALKNSENQLTRATIKDSIKSFNIKNNQNAKVKITSSYNQSGITYNSDSVEIIDLKTFIEYQNDSNQKIYDTIYDDMKLGLNIRLTDSNGQTVSKNYLQNIKFKINEEYFSPNNDGITRIKISDNSNEMANTLSIITSKTNMSLPEGTYYLEISSLAAYDGLYSKNKSSESIKIPINLTSKKENIDNYNFDIKPEKDYRVLYKKENAINLKYYILQNGNYQNPNIRVMLFKKDKLTAYDQSYSLINLNNYVKNELEKITDSVFYAIKNPEFYNGTDESTNKFNLELNLSKFKPGGYKLIFDLYDDANKIGTIENKFIVR